jgi:hypothetical protein
MRRRRKEEEDVVVVSDDNTAAKLKMFLPVYVAIGNVDGRHGCSIFDKVCITTPNVPFQVQAGGSDPLTELLITSPMWSSTFHLSLEKSNVAANVRFITTDCPGNGSQA